MPRTALDLSLYLVTDTGLCAPRGVAAVVALGRQVADVLRGSRVPLVVNDRVDLVAAIGADGAHVGQGDLDPTRARELLRPDAVLGLSVQTVEHVEAARAHGAGVLDYLGVGPVWPQATKPDAAAPGGLARLRDVVRASPWPCVAIGGVDAARVRSAREAREAREAGAAGVAVVSAVCGRSDTAAAVRELRTAWAGAAPSPEAPLQEAP